MSYPQTGVASVSVPTWYFGHEPPNVFSSGIAEFFSNAIREDVLLRGATHGVIVLPGAAGTVHEIFQLATDSYYAAEPGEAVPLVLVGRDYWRPVDVRAYTNCPSSANSISSPGRRRCRIRCVATTRAPSATTIQTARVQRPSVVTANSTASNTNTFHGRAFASPFRGSAGRRH